MQSYHSVNTPLRRTVSFSHYPNEQIMAGATPYIQPQEIFPLPGPGSYHDTLGLNGMGMASPYMSVYSPSTATNPSYQGAYRNSMYPHHTATRSRRRYTRSPSLTSTETSSSESYTRRGRDPSQKILNLSRGVPPGAYIEPGNLGSRLSDDFPSPPSNIVPLSSAHSGPPVNLRSPSPNININIDGTPGTHQDRFASDSYGEYEGGYGRSPYHRPRRMSSASRYYPEYDDHSRYDRSPHHQSSRYYDRSPHHYSSSRYYDRDRYDRYNRYDQDYDRRYYDGNSSRYYSSGHRGRNGENLMYRRTTRGDVQVLRNGRETIGDKVRRAIGLDPKGVHVVRLKPGESLVGPGRRY